MAVNNPTTNYSFVLPTVGGSADAWGTVLNTLVGDDATGLDAVIKTVDTDAKNASNLSSGTVALARLPDLGAMAKTVLAGTYTWDLGAGVPLPAHATTQSGVLTVAGAAVGDVVIVAQVFAADSLHLQSRAYVSATNTVRILVTNTNTVEETMTSREQRVFVIKAA